MAFDWMDFFNDISIPFQIIGIIFIVLVLLLIIIGFGALSLTTPSMTAFTQKPIPNDAIALPGLILFFCFAYLIYYLLRLFAGRHMVVKPDKRSFTFGEKITGNIIINRNIAKQARSLKLCFYGIQAEGKYRECVCKKETTLTGARLFRKGEIIPFSINMPNSVKDYIGANYDLKDKNYLRVALLASPYIHSWNIEAKLDLQGEMDLTRTVMIRIVPASDPINSGKH